MRKLLLLALALVLSASALHAQVPADVKAVMDKCSAAMSSPDGVEYDMDMKFSLGFVSLGHSRIIMASKGDMFLTSMSVSLADDALSVISGFDGSQSWEVKHTSKYDTIHIYNGKRDLSADDNKGIDFDVANEYKKAKMKLVDGCYEIVFSKPIDKKADIKEVEFKIDAKSYQLRQMKTAAKGVKVTMSLNKTKKGLSDNYFKLNTSQYPNAIILRD